MVRNVLAVLGGMVVGSLANMAIILVMMVIWPLPDGVDFQDPVAMAAYTATLPATAWIMAVLAHLAQCLVGGGAAASLGTKPMGTALAVGALSMVGGVMNLINLQAPVGMWLELPLYLLVAGGVGRVVASRKAA